MIEQIKLIAFKGFDADMKCRGFQYEVGKSYTHEGDVKACESGFHACEAPLDIFSYYPPATSRFALVAMDGPVSREDGGDTKIAAAKITIETELRLPELIRRGVDWILAKAESNEANTGYRSAATNTGDRSAATNTGNQSAATNTGDRSAATNTGDRSAATNTGYRSAATNTGNRSAATNTGYRSAASVSGQASTAMATGFEGKVMAETDGCGLYAEEREWNGDAYVIKSNASGITGRGKIKAGTWYVCKSGRLVEITQ